jgi:DNA-binding response OmpR family regulator
MKGARIKKIVIVDDDRAFLDELQDAIFEPWYKIVAVCDSLMAADVISKVKPDLILLDLMMPKKNGFQVMKELRAHQEYRETPVIVLSSMDDDISKYMSVKSGCTEFLRKPPDIEQLKFHIEDMLCKQATKEGGDYDER